MARYIDADKLIAEYDRVHIGPPGRARKLMEEAPTSEVAEVKCGEWELKSEIHRFFDEVDEEFYVECPFCERVFYVPFEFQTEKMLEYARETYPYCNCGAKMDGGNGLKT